MTDTRNVVITGASTGIGKTCARYLAERGFRVFAGVRKQSDADRLSREMAKNLVPIFLDITKIDEIAQVAETISGAVGDHGLAALVNNAGVSVGGPLEIVPIERLREQLEINVIGQVAATQAFLPHLRRATGRIVNIGSISGRIAMPMIGPYPSVAAQENSAFVWPSAPGLRRFWRWCCLEAPGLRQLTDRRVLGQENIVFGPPSNQVLKQLRRAWDFLRSTLEPGPA